MKKNKRRSIRLKRYNYTQPGAYFITLCTHKRRPHFGSIANKKMNLSTLGYIAQDEWICTAQLRTNVELDAFVFMPDHMHGIIIIKEESHPKHSDFFFEQFGKPIPNSIPSIIRAYKAAVTREIRKYYSNPNLKKSTILGEKEKT